ncbi:unnamed protein product [Cuscuta europaea]|uniref:Miraculin-like n=1 Tax=Cuscuta europaea TaxID=41803 RepID=A0A9P0YL38_CUSEU|nr:unnamed protein product [Cuscuta europaea]
MWAAFLASSMQTLYMRYPNLKPHIRSITRQHKMKTWIPFLLFLLSSFHGEAAVRTVLDVHGNGVQSGVKYYVVPVNKTQGGGLDLLPPSTTCYRNVVAVPTKLLANAASFFPAVAPKNGVVVNGTDLNVEIFPSGANAGNCSNVWTISGSDPENIDMDQYVLSGGVKGNPGSTTAVNWFMIVKSVNGYKFMFCPVSLCDCSPVCQDVGIFVDKAGNRLLKVQSSLPHLEVNFIKA